MDEVGDAVKYALRGAVRGAKQGYRITKRALQTLPGETLRVTGADGVMSRVDIRRLFQMKYGAEVSNERGERMAAADLSEIEESDEDTLTDEQVQERVDKKYFDKNYDAMKHEVSNIPVTYSGTDEERLKERQDIEVSIKERRVKCEVVSTTLKRRILQNHQVFVNGVEYIKQINDNLLQTSSDCKKGRAFIRKAKGNVAVSLAIITRARQKRQLKATVAVTEAMLSLCQKRSQLLVFLSDGQVVEAAKLLREKGEIEQEDALSRIECMRRIIAEWRDYRDNKAAILGSVQQAITECLTTKFIPTKYRYSFEATMTIGDVEDICQVITMLLWKTAVHILTRSITEMSNVKDESAPITDIVAGVDPSHLLLCVCQMCARMMDFLFLYATVVKLHRDNSKLNTAAAHIHTVALQNIKPVGRRIGRDLCEKIRMILEHAEFQHVDVERVLHMFYVVSMLIEATSTLGLEKVEVAEARTVIKTSLEAYMLRCHQQPRARQILQFLADEAWTVGDLHAGDLLVVQSLSPEPYRVVIKQVKKYLSDASIDSGAAGENPFYAPHMASLPNTADMVHTEQLRQSLEKSSGAPAKELQEMTTASSVAVANMIFENVARLVVRFPPVASEALGWCEDLVSMYIYVVADNFVSISRMIPLEDQGDCSAATKATLVAIHATAERAAGVQVLQTADGPVTVMSSSITGSSALTASGGTAAGADLPHFPPRVWTRIRSKYTSETYQYAIVNRAIALGSCVSLTQLLDAAIRSVAPLLPEAIVQQRKQQCGALQTAAVELLHICFHRLSQAIFPMENVCSEIAKIRANEKELKGSAYVAQLVHDMETFNAKRQKFPTANLEVLFLKRFIFAVQSVLLREYCKLGKKKSSDALVMQLSVDAQGFTQQVIAMFGRENVVLPDYVSAIIKAGFATDPTAKIEWMRSNHATYFSNDVLAWLAGSDRALRQQMEAVLHQLAHHDSLPVAPFL